MYSASDSISANITDVTMRVITIIKYPFRLEQLQNVVGRASPGGLAVLCFKKGTCNQTQISLVSALFLCRTYSYCLHGSSIRYLRYLVRKRTLHSHAKYTYRTFNSHPGTYTFDQHSHCLEQICQLCGATTASPWQLCPVWAYHPV